MINDVQDSKGVDTADLQDKVRTAFPALPFDRAKLVNNGDDHAVLILNDALVMRFPRTPEYKASFQREIRLLALLSKRTSIAVTRYQYISQAQDFGGYPLIAGEELRIARFQQLTAKQRDNIAMQLADFLSALHGLPVSSLPPLKHDVQWGTEELWRYTERYIKERREAISGRISANLLTTLDAFFPAYQRQRCLKNRVIHDDLTDDHILIGNNDEIGIIDFGDATVGDPAKDFCYFWCYGEQIARSIFDHYAYRSDDLQLLDRSHWHFVRWLIDQLYYAVRDNTDRDFEFYLGMLEGEIDKLPKGRNGSCT